MYGGCEGPSEQTGMRVICIAWEIEIDFFNCICFFTFKKNCQDGNPSVDGNFPPLHDEPAAATASFTDRLAKKWGNAETSFPQSSE